MTERKNPAEAALDLLVYAPIGLALEAREHLPELIERGRRQVDNQVTLARMMGQFAVQQGQSEAEKRFGKAGEQATSALSDLGLLPKRGDGSRDRPAATAPTAKTGPTAARPASTTPPPPDAGPEVVATDLADARADVAASAAAAAAPQVTELAVPDYDSLAASQVIPRLAGLSGEELEAVRIYEAAKRGRKTILNRIAQLQSA